MPPATPIESLAHTIQLSVAPVFLLSGVAGFLSVLTNRLARIVDRTRALEGNCPDSGATNRVSPAAALELVSLRHRTRLINRAIGLCVCCAILVAGVVAALFLGAFVRLNLQLPVAATFVAAMLALTAGLLTFLREIAAATRFMRRSVLLPGEPAPTHATTGERGQ